MVTKEYKIQAVATNSEVKTNRFVSMLDSEKFDIVLEKVLQAMFSVIIIVGVPYLLYIVAKGMF